MKAINQSRVWDLELWHRCVSFGAKHLQLLLFERITRKTSAVQYPIHFCQRQHFKSGYSIKSQKPLQSPTPIWLIRIVVLVLVEE
jgi:hypothetical protein